MKLLALVLVGALAAVACAGPAAQPSPTPTRTPTEAPATPSPSPTPETTVELTADLRASNEVPPISNEEANAAGTATVTFELTRDASGNITAATASFDIELTDFPDSSQIVVAHIHNAPAGANAGVVVGIKTDAANPLAVSGGEATITVSDVEVEPELAQQILDNPGDFYVNVHTAANGGGAVRGQLTRS